MYSQEEVQARHEAEKKREEYAAVVQQLKEKMEAAERGGHLLILLGSGKAGKGLCRSRSGSIGNSSATADEAPGGGGARS